MHTRRSAIAVIVAVAVLLLVAALVPSGGSTTAATGDRAGETEGATQGETEGEADGGEEEGKGGAAEAAEQAQEAAERLEAWNEAKAAGTLRVNQAEVAAAAAPAAGWAGEQVFSTTADDWEPAIAADPNAPYVYVLTTRYTGPTACGNKCPLPYIMLKVSTNGGASWGPDRYICTCSGIGSQADPIIEVVPNTGAVYAVFMNGFNVMFTKSTDHGATWTTPVKTYGKVSWNDKPILAMSDNGSDVYVSWNGPQNGDPYVAQSHDGGATWTQTRIVNSTRYFFAFDGDVLPNGTVVFSRDEPRLRWSRAGRSSGRRRSTCSARPTTAGRSRRTSSTRSSSRPTAQQPAVRRLLPRAQRDHCRRGRHAQCSCTTARRSRRATRRSGRAAPPTAAPPGRRVRRCRRPARWPTSPRPRLAEPATCAPGTCRPNGGNFDAWNVWYRASTDGGVTWSAPVKISDVTAGASYKTANGFLEPYGDYGEAAITNTGKFIGIWGRATPTRAPAACGSTGRRSAGGRGRFTVALARAHRGILHRVARDDQPPQYAIAHVAVSTPGWPHTTQEAPGSSGSSGRNRIVAFVSVLTRRLALCARRTTQRSRTRRRRRSRSASSS